MKKMIKNNIVFILGVMLCSGIVYGANLYNPRDILYTKSDGTKANVNDVISDLYTNCGSSGEPESYCTSTGVLGCGWSTSDYGGDGNSCSQRTTYSLGSALVVGYRPVVTVYKK